MYGIHRAPDDWERLVRRGKQLASQRDPAGIEVLVSGLRWRYDTARNSAIGALVSLGPTITPRLLRVLRIAETAVERRAAVDGLGLLKSKDAVPDLLRALRDPNMVVRRAAMAALARIGASESVPQISTLLKDESGGVRVLAAGVLGQFGDRRAVPALVRSLRDEKWYVRQAAAASLGVLRDRRAIRPLETASRDSRPAVSKAARASLKALGKDRH